MEGERRGRGEGEKGRSRVKGREVVENNQLPLQQPANRTLSLTNSSYTHTYVRTLVCLLHSATTWLHANCQCSPSTNDLHSKHLLSPLLYTFSAVGK